MGFITNKIAFRSIKLIKCKWCSLLLYGSFEINQQVMIYCDLIVVNKFAWSQKPETRFPNIYGCWRSMPSSRLCGNEKLSLPSQGLQHSYYQMACSDFNGSHREIREYNKIGEGILGGILGSLKLWGLQVYCLVSQC